MSAIKLYSLPISPPCRSVIMTTKVLGLEVELVNVDMFNKGNQTEEFIKINPVKTIPALVDGDFKLWESRAIMRYLVSKYGGADNKLYPKDLQKRALIDALLDYDLGTYYKSILENAMMPVYKKQEPTEEQDKKVTEAIKWLDAHVKDRKYVAGNELTIADFAIVVGTPAFAISKVKISDYPNASAWYARMKELPYYDEVNQPFYKFLEQIKKDFDGK